jgi:hypothetical protein
MVALHATERFRERVGVGADAVDLLRQLLDRLAQTGIAALRASDREELIALTRRHLVPSPQAYIRAYQRRFGGVAPNR